MIIEIPGYAMDQEFFDITQHVLVAQNMIIDLVGFGEERQMLGEYNRTTPSQQTLQNRVYGLISEDLPQFHLQSFDRIEFNVTGIDLILDDTKISRSVRERVSGWSSLTSERAAQITDAYVGILDALEFLVNEHLYALKHYVEGFELFEKIIQTITDELRPQLRVARSRPRGLAAPFSSQSSYDIEYVESIVRTLKSLIVMHQILNEAAKGSHKMLDGFNKLKKDIAFMKVMIKEDIAAGYITENAFEEQKQQIRNGTSITKHSLEVIEQSYLLHRNLITRDGARRDRELRLQRIQDGWIENVTLEELAPNPGLIKQMLKILYGLRWR